MKKIFKRLVFALAISTMLLGSVPLTSYAMETSVIASTEMTDNAEFRTRADEIGYYHFWDLNGVEWIRLYNYTKGIWLEPEWHRA